MDKPIAGQVAASRKRKTLLLIIASVAVLAAAIVWLRTVFRPSLKKSAITTAVVERGLIENTINASGEVLPEFEEIITSPITASIRQILLEEGHGVKAGQSVLTLDKAATQLEYENLAFQLESKRNSIHKLKLELDKSFFDLQSNDAIKQLHINSLKASVENAKRLLNAGGGTREDVEQAELNLKVALLEKTQLENEIKNKQQTMQADMRESEIAAQIQQNDLQALERKLRLASIVAGRDGVVTWINKSIGATVREGDPLAHIADLGSFKVTGSLSDNYTDQLHLNMTAIVRINDEQLRGTVVNISPAVQNGIVSFDIRLNERNNKLLRPNMKVDVFLVTAMHNDVLRVANGPAFRGAAGQDIFVLSNGRAERRSVHLGMSNFDYVEIKDNIRPGDVVITSDMTEYKNVSEIIINN